MIFGIGVDLIELERIRKIVERSELAFIKKILTSVEIEHLPRLPRRKIEYLAGRFAGKEAVAKALGTGIGKNLNWKDIEILPLPSGKPTVTLKNDYWPVDDFKIHISISHSQSMAIAKVLIEQI
ncbi:holo-ACP synthase [Tepidibacillus fermentans]|uniref:Holo-[acyl-carrier-protein] synthase n=1 Tax=Tepidibacillus fermentans TaxID=1281767 RepID=A0A4R3K675_9BACI|nr:holo-ACP synthase [Tepidibacillus fermentans]TCS78356.1 holo-[acyl-carrier-protein] synthase [Tepidibacillus fermentans]